MAQFTVSLTSTTVERAEAEIEAGTAEEAQGIMMHAFQEGNGAYESDFFVVGGHTSVDQGDAEPQISRSVKTIERLIAVAGYELDPEVAICDLLADIHHYCDKYDINFYHQACQACEHVKAEKEEEEFADPFSELSLEQLKRKWPDCPPV